MTAYSQGFHSINQENKGGAQLWHEVNVSTIMNTKCKQLSLQKEIGGAKAAKELGIPEGTIHTWLKAVRTGQLDIGEGAHTPESAMSLAEELTMLRKTRERSG